MFLMSEVAHTKLLIDFVGYVEREVVLIGIRWDVADTAVEILIVVFDCEVGEQWECYEAITAGLAAAFECDEFIIDGDNLCFSEGIAWVMALIEFGSGKIIPFGVEIQFFDVDDIVVDVELQCVWI